MMYALNHITEPFPFVQAQSLLNYTEFHKICMPISRRE